MALTREQGIELKVVLNDRRRALLDELREDAGMSRDLAELREVEAARERMTEGSYGLCTECGAEIDYRRLRAYPSALRCIDCQRRAEKARPGERPTL